MNASIYRISLDIQEPHSGVALDAKRGDLGRRIHITLTDGGFPYQISPECYAVFTATKPDGNKVFNNCAIEGNTIVYAMTPQTVSAVGIAECEIQVYGADDDLLTSACFNLVINERVIQEDDEIESETEVDALTNLISEATTAIYESRETTKEGQKLIKEMEEHMAGFAFPTFDLTALGLPNIKTDGKVVSVETDTTAIREALSKNHVNFVFSLEYGGLVFTKANFIADPCANTGSYQIVGIFSFGNFASIVTITVHENKIVAYAIAAGTAPEEISAMQKDIADLKKFHPIAISSVTNNVGTVELGRSIDAVTVTWVLNKEPVSQTVDGKAVDVADRFAVVEGPFTSGKTFAVTATDTEGNTAKGSTGINFYNGVYYGALDTGVLPDSAAVLKLTRKLQSGRSATIPYAPATGKRPSYACPARYGTPKFVIGGFEYAWVKLGTIEFTNASGYTEEYDVWQHPQDVAESITISVS